MKLNNLNPNSNPFYPKTQIKPIDNKENKVNQAWELSTAQREDIEKKILSTKPEEPTMWDLMEAIYEEQMDDPRLRKLAKKVAEFVLN